MTTAIYNAPHFHKLPKKVNRDFYDLCLTDPAFAACPDAVAANWRFLKYVSRRNAREEEDIYSQMKATEIKALFKVYATNYHPCIEANIELGLLRVDETYCSKLYDSAGKGRSYGYYVTDLAHSLLQRGYKEYIIAAHTDKTIRRNIQKNVSKRGVMHKEYSDYVLAYIYDFLIHASFDAPKAFAILDKFPLVPVALTNVYHHLDSFTDKRFDDLQYKTGRVWTPWSSLKKEARQAFTYKGMPRQAVVDIRACHPTFFAEYLFRLYENKSDSFKMFTFDDINLERIRWNSNFTNPEDYRLTIGKECKYCPQDAEKCPPKVKEYLNKTINGYKTHKPLLRWLGEFYPCLYAVFDSLDDAERKKVGPEISTLFESKITLNEELFHTADSRGVKLAYENDGFSIFSKTYDQETFEEIKKCMIKTATDTLKLPIEVVIKRTEDNLTNEDLPWLDETAKEFGFESRDVESQELFELLKEYKIQDKLLKGSYARRIDDYIAAKYEEIRQKKEEIRAQITRFQPYETKTE